MSARIENYYLTENAHQAFISAELKACADSSEYVRWNHLLYALAQNPNFTSYKILERLGISIKEFVDAIIFPENSPGDPPQRSISLGVRKIKYRAQINANNSKRADMSTGDILYAIFSEKWRIGTSQIGVDKISEDFDITPLKIELAFLELIG